MAISFDTALGIHPLALDFRGKRAEVLAGNLANIDTPGFKSKDITFETVMDAQLKKTGDDHSLHMEVSSQGDLNKVMYRIPYQQSADGNTVELGVEQSTFSQNSLEFQTSLMFLKKKLSSLELAIRGMI